VSEQDESKGEIDVPEGLDHEGVPGKPATWPNNQNRFYQDGPDWPDEVPPERIVFVEDEAGKLFSGVPGGGKTNAVDKLIQEMLAAGRSEKIHVEPDPDLAALLNAKREEIERDLPGVFPRVQYSEPQWIYGEHKALHAPMLRIMDGKSCYRPADCAFEETPDWFPVRVGDVVRVIDTQRGERPVPGHVVDIEGWWVYVSGPLGPRQPFYGQTGYRAGEYRWRLEPYITEEESNR
jgi:hypothetical protein